MKALVWKAMADGAVGFSTGLQYVPGTYAADAGDHRAGARGGQRRRHLRLAHAERGDGARGGGRRDDPRRRDDRRRASQISHLKVDSPNRWGASDKALAHDRRGARRKAIDVRADQYAYTAASSSLGIRFPSWVLEGGQSKIAERLNTPATWDKIKPEMAALLAERGLRDLSFAVVAMYRPDASLNGLSMQQIARRSKAATRPTRSSRPRAT